MNTIYIVNWYGRLGNNIIQLLNGITFGLQNNFNKIIFPYHEFFNNNEIIFDTNNYPERNIIATYENDFYYLAIKNIIKYNINIKELFNKYIKPIIRDINYNYNNNYDLTIYLRSGDIFKGNYNNEYVQPPLSYYEEIIKRENTNNIILITEELNNPTAKYYNEINNYKWNKNDIKTDINYLINSKVVVLGLSIFCLIFILLSNKIKKIYVADYIYKRYKENWKIDLKDIINKNQELIIIKLDDNYEKIGSEQLKLNNYDFMLNLCNKHKLYIYNYTIIPILYLSINNNLLNFINQ